MHIVSQLTIVEEPEEEATGEAADMEEIAPVGEPVTETVADKDAMMQDASAADQQWYQWLRWDRRWKRQG